MSTEELYFTKSSLMSVFGISEPVANLMLYYSQTMYLYWAIDNAISTDTRSIPDKMKMQQLEEVTFIPLYRIQNCYFIAMPTPESELKKHEEYKFIVLIISRIFNNYQVIIEQLLPYVFFSIKKFLVMVLSDVGMKPQDIIIRLNMGKSTVYNVIEDYKKYKICGI